MATPLIPHFCGPLRRPDRPCPAHNRSSQKTGLKPRPRDSRPVAFPGERSRRGPPIWRHAEVAGARCWWSPPRGLDLPYPYRYSCRVFTVRLTEEFQAWLDDLADRRAQVRIAARLRQAEAGNLGDWASVGGEVSELRVHFGPGYRLYFTRRGGVLIIMLAGGDKGSQARDIKRAQRIVTELKEEP